jgi:hypothetical protein
MHEHGDYDAEAEGERTCKGRTTAGEHPGSTECLTGAVHLAIMVCYLE